MNTYSIKRRSYWLTDVIEPPGDRIVGSLVSTPCGYRLYTTNRGLRWFRSRLFKTPADLVASINHKGLT